MKHFISWVAWVVAGVILACAGIIGISLFVVLLMLIQVSLT